MLTLVLGLETRNDSGGDYARPAAENNWNSHEEKML